MKQTMIKNNEKRAIIIFERPSHTPYFTRLNFHGVKCHMLELYLIPVQCHLPINHNSTVFELFFSKTSYRGRSREHITMKTIELKNRSQNSGENIYKICNT